MDRFGSSFGGDAMISYCAAYVQLNDHNNNNNNTNDNINININNNNKEKEKEISIESVQHHLKKVLKLEPGLHQIDMRGDANGFFNSGFLITSWHHLISWFVSCFFFFRWFRKNRGGVI